MGGPATNGRRAVRVVGDSSLEADPPLLLRRRIDAGRGGAWPPRCRLGRPSRLGKLALDRPLRESRLELVKILKDPPEDWFSALAASGWLGHLVGILRAAKNVAERLDRDGACVLVHCSDGYFKSMNCMIELRSTVSKGKPIIPVLDPDQSRGGLTKAQIKQQLIESDGKWERWGFNTDDLGDDKGEELYSTLFSYEPVDWNRIGAFQDVTMRLIAERLLCHQKLAAPLKVVHETTHSVCAELMTCAEF